MNIIIDETTHKQLQTFILDTIEFGSAMKNTADINSDHDYLHIISQSTLWMQAPYNVHHLLQFNDGQNDHIYCTPQTFVKGLLDGDSTIFHEIHQYKALTGTCLEFLQRYNFDYYTTQRAYLGIAKRDLKDCTKLFCKDERKARKKFKFALTAYNYVNSLNGSTESVEYVITNDIKDVQAQCCALSDKIEALRKQINIAFDQNLIERTLDPDKLLAIDITLRKIKQHEYSYGMKYFRDAFYKGFV